MALTNKHNVSLATAVWLVTDDYDYVDEKNYISVTSLMKPLRQLCLQGRGDKKVDLDVTDLLASRMGHAFHDSIERSWKNNFEKALKALGYPEAVIKRIKINPEKVEADDIPVYMEQRAKREFLGWKIGGKFDFVAEGMVQDFKSTSVFAWKKGSKDDDYILQGSLYRWLNPDKITEDVMRINFIFKDWSKNMAKSDKDYPQHPVAHKDLPLMSIAETEAWVRNKLRLIEQYAARPDADIPECSDKELWRDEPVYKIYSDKTKAAEGGRSLKNYDSLYDANKHVAEKGKGFVVCVPGVAKRCEYCESRLICKQRERIRPDLTE